MRKVFILENGGAQKKLCFEIDENEVKTLGDLIPMIENNGVSTTDKAFYESKSRIQLMDSQAILPSNEADNGKLVIMVTNAQKKISNGVLEGAKRPEINAYIREHNLAKVISEHFNRNWTNVPSVDLVRFINELVGCDIKKDCSDTYNAAVRYVQDCECDCVRTYLLQLLGAEESSTDEDELADMDVNELFGWV